MSEPTLHDVLHILRNPHGWTPDAIRAAQLKACDLLEAAAPVPTREWVPVGERLPRMFETCVAYGIVKSLNVGRQMWEARRWTGANWPDPPWEWLTPCDLSITDVTHWYSLDRPGRAVVPANSDRALHPPPAADNEWVKPGEGLPDENWK